MSLEDAILKHAAALGKLAAAIDRQAQLVGQVPTSPEPEAQAPAVEKPTKPAKPVKEKPAAEAPKAELEKPAAPAAPAADRRKTLAKLVLDLVAAKGRTPVFAALTPVHPGLTKQSDIPDEKLDEAIAALEAIA